MIVLLTVLRTDGRNTYRATCDRYGCHKSIDTLDPWTVAPGWIVRQAPSECICPSCARAIAETNPGPFTRG